jgi:hypothetical protein
MAKLQKYLVKIRNEVLPKSPAAKAVRYELNQWDALSRFLEDGDLGIDNGATERANRDIAHRPGQLDVFGSDNGGKTAAVLLSFIAMCKRNAVERFAWFRHVPSRIARILCVAWPNCSRITGSLSTLLLTPDIQVTVRGRRRRKRFTRRLRCSLLPYSLGAECSILLMLPLNVEKSSVVYPLANNSRRRTPYASDNNHLNTSNRARRDR